MKNWDEMEPEERDGLIAEKLMGWQEKPCTEHSTDIIEFVGGWECPCGVQGDWSEEGFKLLDHHMMLPPRYSQSLDVAWEIIKKFSDYEVYHRFQVHFMDKFEEAVSDDWDEDGLTYAGLAQLTPEQICKYALQVWEVDLKDAKRNRP